MLCQEKRWTLHNETVPCLSLAKESPGVTVACSIYTPAKLISFLFGEWARGEVWTSRKTHGHLSAGTHALAPGRAWRNCLQNTPPKLKMAFWGSSMCHCPVFFPDSEALEGSQPSLQEVACPDDPACEGWSLASDWFISCQDEGSHLCLIPPSRLRQPFAQNDTSHPWPIWVVT